VSVPVLRQSLCSLLSDMPSGKYRIYLFLVPVSHPVYRCNTGMAGLLRCKSNMASSFNSFVASTINKRLSEALSVAVWAVHTHWAG
jgi:hypothetical protein